MESTNMKKLIMIFVMLTALFALNAETLVKVTLTSEYLEEPVVQTDREVLEDIELYDVNELKPYFLDTKSKITDKHAYWYDTYKVPFSVIDDDPIWEDGDFAYITLVWERW